MCFLLALIGYLMDKTKKSIEAEINARQKSSENMALHTIRFEASSESFFVDPEGYIKSLIGIGARIIKWTKNSIIMSNSKVIIDVLYEKPSISPIVTHYIKPSELKSLSGSNIQFIFEKDGVPVSFIMADPELMKKKKIPLDIRPTAGKHFYKYLAVPADEPLHAYSTITRNQYGLPSVESFIMNEHGKITRKELYNIKETRDAYMKAIAHFDLLKSINNLKEVKSYKETMNSDSSTGFLMHAKDLPNEQIFGCILITPHRVSDVLFYYPNSTQVITQGELNFIKRFIEFDKSNLPE